MCLKFNFHQFQVNSLILQSYTLVKHDVQHNNYEKIFIYNAVEIY